MSQSFSPGNSRSDLRKLKSGWFVSIWPRVDTRIYRARPLLSAVIRAVIGTKTLRRLAALLKHFDVQARTASMTMRGSRANACSFAVRLIDVGHRI